jgi:hypothetical protein
MIHSNGRIGSHSWDMKYYSAFQHLRINNQKLKRLPTLRLTILKSKDIKTGVVLLPEILSDLTMTTKSLTIEVLQELVLVATL